MEYAVGILMICFSGFLLFYALVLFLTKNARLIPRETKASIRNRPLYAVMFSKIIALIALPFMISGIVSFFSGWGALAAFLITMAAAIFFSVRIYRKVSDKVL